FSLDKNDPNPLRPGERTFHTLIPSMINKDGKPFMMLVAMGGEGQPQTHSALITRVIDFGYDIQDALESPRWFFRKRWGNDSNTLKLEGRIEDTVMIQLDRYGHKIEIVEHYSQVMGHAQGILIDEKTGVYSAGADPRGDGLGLSW